MSTDHLASHEARQSFLQALEETTMPQTDELKVPSISLHDTLPLELLPLILSHLRYRQDELARTCLVCKRWYAESKPVSEHCYMVHTARRAYIEPTMLYSSVDHAHSATHQLLWEWVRAPRDSERIVRAFSALSKKPELCSYVKELEVRVYPLASQTRLDDLQEEALQIFKHADNLKTLVKFSIL